MDWGTIAATVAGNAAEIGAGLDLKDNPSHRPLYAAAKGALDALVRDGKWDAVKFQQALRLLPVGAFQGNLGLLIAGTIVQVYDAATGELLLVESAPALAKVITSVRDGLERALAASPAVKTRAVQPVIVPDTKRVRRI